MGRPFMSGIYIEYSKGDPDSKGGAKIVLSDTLYLRPAYDYEQIELVGAKKNIRVIIRLSENDTRRLEELVVKNVEKYGFVGDRKEEVEKDV